MKLSRFGRMALALFASLALGLGMTACGGYTVAYMWVLGQVPGSPSGQIAGFKVDSYTGNLTQVPSGPFSSNGSNPVSIVVKAGGRYVYVLNQGTYNQTTGVQTGDGVIEYTVGGDGTLNYQQTYHSVGHVPMWMQTDSTGNYLYVLDKYSPDYGTYVNGSLITSGSLTAFVIDSTTGRLQLVQNKQSIPSGGVATNFWYVGGSPLMMKTAGSCMFTVNTATQTITPYGIGSNGQLTTVTTGDITTGATNITSINGNGSYMILTDAGTNKIIPYTIGGGGCTLSILAGGIISNIPGTSNPTYSLISQGGSISYVYVLNQSTTDTTTGVPYSSISGFLLTPGQGLTPVSGNTLFPVDSGPVCMVEDPTNQFMYISGHDSGTITGKVFSQNTGQLSDLKRGSSFAAAGRATCLVISGAVD